MYSTVMYSAVQYSKVLCSTIQYSSVQISLYSNISLRKHGGQFSAQDIAIVEQSLGATIGVLLTNLTLESELRIKSHLQKLLTVAKNLFSHLGDVTVLLRQIMAEARHLTQAERCSLFLVDKKSEELVAKVFDGNILADGTAEVCFSPLNQQD